MVRKARMLFFLPALAGLAAGADRVQVSQITDGNGAVTVCVTNRHTSPITALLLDATVTRGGGRAAVITRYVDVYVNAGQDSTIGPGQTSALWSLPAVAPGGGTLSMVVDAAVFADGRRYGSEKGLRILAGRRRGLLDALLHGRGLLERGRSAGLSSVRMGVDSAMQALMAETRRMPPEEIPSRTAGALVAQTIKNALDGPAPPDCAGDCAAERIERLLQRLSVWESHVRQGLQEIGP
jgi:hypothetical protein